MAVDPYARVLALLDGVRETSDSTAIACCPVHGDKRPSLSVRRGDDGRVLVNCFAGCPPADVVEALGLTFVDLFPEREKRTGFYYAPSRSGRRIPARDVLELVAREAGVVQIIGSWMLEHRDIAPETYDELQRAVERIAAIYDEQRVAA